MDNSNISTLQLRGFGDILKTTFRLYRKHLLLFLGIISLELFGNLVAYLLARFLPDFLLKDLVTDIVRIPFELVSIGGIIVATATVYLGGHITSRDTLKQALRRFWHIFACHLTWSLGLEIQAIGVIFPLVFLMSTESMPLVFLMSTESMPILFLSIFTWLVPVTFLTYLSTPSVMNLIIFVMIPGLLWMRFILLALAPFSIYFAVRWTCATAAILLESPLIRRAFERSRKLTRGRWWQVWGMLISFSALSFAIPRIILIAVGFILALTKLTGVPDAMGIIRLVVMREPIDTGTLFIEIIMATDLVVRTLVFPIWVIGITLLYFALRIRKEGLDIEMQMNNTTATHTKIQ